MGLEVFPLGGIPEVEKGSDLVRLVVDASRKRGIAFRDGDIVVIKQKVVSKSEGRLVRLSAVTAGPRARRVALEQGKDPRLVELILRESRRIVRAGHGVIITETKLGFVCANSGIDKSNVRHGFVSLLPLDPDRSARVIRAGLEKKTRRRLAVIISDTFGRPWRRGQTDVAIGSSGITPLKSYVGERDTFGYNLRVTEPAIIDEVAGAAELVMGKLSGVPVAVVRGLSYAKSGSGASSLVLEKRKDLFR